MDYQERTLRFACDGSDLFGIASVPDKALARGVLIVVGGPQYRVGSHRQFVQLARALAEQGIAAMRFDYRGMGDSGGEMRDFEAVDDDLRAAVDQFFTAVPGLRDVVIWGLCDAASAALFYAHGDPRISGLVLLNPWVRTNDGIARTTLKHYYRARLLDPELWKKIARGDFNFSGAARSFARLIGAATGVAKPARDVLDIATLSLPERMLASMQNFKGKVLLILSGADLTAQEFLDMAEGSPQWQKLLAMPDVNRQTLAGADHTFSRQIWKTQVIHWTRDWVRSW